LYYLSTFDNPHAPFELKPTDEIVIIFQSMKLTQAKEVAYDRFKAMVDECPYFQNYFMYDKDIKSQLRFPHHITVMPVAGNEAATIGKNVIGGIADREEFVECLDRLYREPAARADLSRRGIENAGRDCYRWPQIGAAFGQLLEQALDPTRLTRVSDGSTQQAGGRGGDGAQDPPSRKTLS
ncbi:hypothetical protein LCGC14_2440820, partial [marine sediment metagenome]